MHTTTYSIKGKPLNKFKCVEPSSNRWEVATALTSFLLSIVLIGIMANSIDSIVNDWPCVYRYVPNDKCKFHYFKFFCPSGRIQNFKHFCLFSRWRRKGVERSYAVWWCICLHLDRCTDLHLLLLLQLNDGVNSSLLVRTLNRLLDNSFIPYNIIEMTICPLHPQTRINHSIINHNTSVAIYKKYSYEKWVF